MSQSSPVDLRAYFAERLPQRLDEVEEAWRKVRQSGWGPEPVRCLHRLAHSLAGTGSTFGIPEVSATSRRLEALLKAAAEDGARPPAAERVEELLAELRRTAELIRAELRG